MKYPNDHYLKALKVLKELNKHITNLKEINPNQLHFLVYQQYSEGQTHNSFYIYNNNLYKGNVLKSMNINEGKKLFDCDNSFELYPNDTNDNNITTAYKKLIKEI